MAGGENYEDFEQTFEATWNASEMNMASKPFVVRMVNPAYLWTRLQP